MTISLFICTSFSSILHLLSTASTVSSQIYKTDVQLLKDTSTDDRLNYPFKVAFERTSKKSETLVHPSTIHRGRVFLSKTHDKFRKQHRFLKVKPEYRKSPSGERPHHLKKPFTQRSMNHWQLLRKAQNKKRRFYSDSYYPNPYQHNHFNNFGEGIHYPYFYPNDYSDDDFNQRFTDEKRHFDTFSFNNQDEKGFLVSESEKFKASSSNDLTSLVTLSTIRFFETSDTDGLAKPRPSSQRTDEQDRLSAASEASKNRTEVAKISSTKIKEPLINSIQKLPGINSKDARLQKSGISDNYFLVSDHRKPDEPPSNSSTETRHQRTINVNADNFNFFGNNKIYYEKNPANVNLTWFIYAQCGQEKCLQLTHTSDETEFVSSGWILYNCTDYECSLMHPKAQQHAEHSIRVVLWVLSLCVLKISVSLLVFRYYRRRKKLSERASKSEDISLWEDGASGFTLRGEKRLSEKASASTGGNRTGGFRPAFSRLQKADSDSTPFGARISRHSPTALEEGPKDDSDTPPAVHGSLIPIPLPGGILIPRKIAGEKKISDTNKYHVPKSKKYRSSIPRLEKWAKAGNSYTKSKSRKTEEDSAQKTPKSSDGIAKGDRDILLMHLEDGIQENRILYCPANFKKEPSRESKAGQECRSFISLDLSGTE